MDPTTQQQMSSQHLGIWMMDMGQSSDIAWGLSSILFEEKEIKISLDFPWKAALESVPS